MTMSLTARRPLPNIAGPMLPGSPLDHLSRSSRNTFAAHRLDRAAERRADRDWILERLADPRTGVVPVWRARNLLTGAKADAGADVDAPVPVFLEPGALGAPEALAERAVLLGEHEGRALFALELAGDEGALTDALPREADFHELRDVGAQLAREDAALLAYARGLIHWRRRHRFCGDCGAPTLAADGGHQLVCRAPACGARHFPRTDPAIIVLVVAGAGDPVTERCLLGRQAIWPERMYSTIAGFVEPGESLEDAVVREVAEETGVVVGDVHYHSSQPWPFPSSLMLGFTATARTYRIERLDEELEDARWVTRGDLVEAIESGELRLPRRVSIAYRLIQDWFDAGHLGPLEAHG